MVKLSLYPVAEVLPVYISYALPQPVHDFHKWDSRLGIYAPVQQHLCLLSCVLLIVCGMCTRFFFDNNCHPIRHNINYY